MQLLILYVQNQEEGVEEPDLVKSDGESVFAAYGKEVRFILSSCSTVNSNVA